MLAILVWRLIRLEGLLSPRGGRLGVIVMRRSVLALTVLVVGLSSGVSVAQTLKPRPPVGTQQQNEDVPVSQKVPENADVESVTVPMSVAAGTPIKVALDSEVRVRKVGQVIRGNSTSC